MRRTLGYTIWGFWCILIDQSVKLFLTISGTEVVINRGIGFGIISGDYLAGLLLNLFGVIVAALIFFKVLKEERVKGRNLYLISLSIITGAGISNFIDRIFRGGVIDYIKIWSIPDFNLADLSITLGTVFVLTLILFDSINERKQKRV